MKDLKEFVDTLVKIEYLDHCLSFGFYPFQMYVEDKDEKGIMCSLDLGGDVRAVYHAFAEHYNKNPKRMYLAVDFPAIGDILSDFVCIIAYEKEEMNLYAIPYSVETGETFSEDRHAEILNKIHDDLGLFIYRAL